MWISGLTKNRHSGTELVIKALGTVSEPIEKGAYIQLQVKYGLIRLISTKADLCEQIKNVDMECPIEEGLLSITKTVSLPAEIPPVSPNIPAWRRPAAADMTLQGKYTVKADVYTADDKPITCLTATVVFSRGDSGLFGSLEL